MKIRNVSSAIAAVVVACSVHSAHAGYFVPGETLGTSLDSPVPTGLYAFDVETYGQSDNSGAGPHLGVNIPGLIWSTPYSLGNTKLEFLAAFPVAHIDGGGIGRVGFLTEAFGPILAHDFGNGFTGGVSAFVRTPDPSSNIAVIDGRTTTEADFRQSLQWTNGDWTINENGGVTSALGQAGYGGPFSQNDFFAGDFAIKKAFGKFQFGFTGVGNVDIDNRNTLGRAASVELGGLASYDFGRFSLQVAVTRSVYVHIDNLIGLPGYETRGWLSAVIPLYVDPKPAAPVIARY